MHLQFHKTLLFPMARWLTDCPDPKVPGKITDKYNGKFNLCFTPTCYQKELQNLR